MLISDAYNIAGFLYISKVVVEMSFSTYFPAFADCLLRVSRSVVHLFIACVRVCACVAIAFVDCSLARSLARLLACVRA